MKEVNMVTILVLCLIVYQDIKYREIHWFLFLILFAAFVSNGMVKLPSLVYFKICVSNLLFLIIQMTLLTGFYYLKGVSIKSILQSYIGPGDLIMFITIAFAFSKVNFIVFYLSGLIFSLIIWLLISTFSTRRNNRVPLAGLLSSYLIFIVLVDFFTSQFERVSDNLLIHLIYG